MIASGVSVKSDRGSERPKRGMYASAHKFQKMVSHPLLKPRLHCGPLQATTHIQNSMQLPLQRHAKRLRKAGWPGARSFPIAKACPAILRSGRSTPEVKNVIHLHPAKSSSHMIAKKPE